MDLESSTEANTTPQPVAALAYSATNSQVSIQTDLFENLGCTSTVVWYNIMNNNHVKLRAVFTMWMACHNSLATKERLKQFNMLHEDTCCFCTSQETLSHLMFEWPTMDINWSKVLSWMKVQHTPQGWNDEHEWITWSCKGKG